MSFERFEETKEQEGIEKGTLPPRLSEKQAKKLEERIDIEEILDKCKAKDRTGFNLFERHGLSSLARLAIELKDRLPEYDTVLSDDASGRIPSLILKDLIDRKREGVQRSKSRIYFIAGGKKMDAAAVRSFLSEKKAGLGKTLLVTDYIASGKSIDAIAAMLEDEHVDFDIGAALVFGHPGTIGYYESEDGYAQYPDRILRHLYYGTEGEDVPRLYDEYRNTGVRKERPASGAHPLRVTGRDWDPERIKDTREDIKTVADELSKLLD